MLLGFDNGGHECSILARHGHKTPSVKREGPKPFPSHLRNMVSPYRSRKGSFLARGDDGAAGKGWRRKPMPVCNGSDTGGNHPARKRADFLRV